MEQIIDLLNSVVSIVAAILGIRLATLSKGGQMEKTWNLLAISAVVFAILIEVRVALKYFSTLNIDSVAGLVELVFLIIFAYSLYSTRKNLQKLLSK